MIAKYLKWPMIRTACIVTFLFLFSLCLLIPSLSASEKEQLPYKDSPREVIIQMVTTGGSESEIIEKTRVPDFTLYGDGRVIYTRQLENQSYRILEARLTPAYINFLLAYIEQEGFYDMNENYLNLTIKHLPSTYISVNLKEKNKTIKIYGMAIAAQQKLLPRGLVNISRKLSEFQADGEKDYDPEKISLYVQEVPKGAISKDIKILKWKVKNVDLSKCVPEGESLIVRYKETVFQGEDKKNLISFFRGKTLFDNPVGFVSTVFDSHKRYYKVAYRPHLPYE